MFPKMGKIRNSLEKELKQIRKEKSRIQTELDDLTSKLHSLSVVEDELVRQIEEVLIKPYRLVGENYEDLMMISDRGIR